MLCDMGPTVFFCNYCSETDLISFSVDHFQRFTYLHLNFFENNHISLFHSSISSGTLTQINPIVTDQMRNKYLLTICLVFTT